MGADNQQERPGGIASNYISGYVDGEGCFSITIQRSSNVKLGIQVIPEFHVCQHQNRSEVLNAIQRKFGCGYIKPNHARNARDLTSVYVVRDINNLRNIIVPFFKKYPLISIKQRDFEKFSAIIEMMSRKMHLTKEGLITILKLAFSMNASGKYRKLRLQDVISVVESSETVRQNPPKAD